MFETPKTVTELCQAVKSAGGRALLVGGWVRDQLLKLDNSKDYDFEIYSLAASDLKNVLSRFGTVSEVGESFQVFKVKTEDGEFDVSLPRRERKNDSGGHKGFDVVGDPTMTVKEAARRRDYTINAISYDPLTGELVDPFNGQLDLTFKVLRVVDESTFVEDSLRVLRGAQFVSRFKLKYSHETVDLMRKIDLTDLPAERLQEEFRKGLVRSDDAGVFLYTLLDFGVIEKLFPEIYAMYGNKQEPDFHPEIDTFIHTDMVLCVMSALLRQDPVAQGLSEVEKFTLLLAALCHDFGKPLTTTVEDGRIRQKAHDVAGLVPTETFLDKINVHTQGGFNIRKNVLQLVKSHLQPGFFGREKEKVSDGAYRKLAQKVDLRYLYLLGVADTLGRGMPFGFKLDGTRFTREAEDYFWQRAVSLKLDGKQPDPPLLTGEELMNLGLEQGKELGRIKSMVYDAQLEGKVTTLEEARELAKNLIAELEYEYKSVNREYGK